MADKNTPIHAKKSLKQDLFEHPDFYNVDGLLTEEQKLVRESMRQFAITRSGRIAKCCRSIRKYSCSGPNVV